MTALASSSASDPVTLNIVLAPEPIDDNRLARGSGRIQVPPIPRRARRRRPATLSPGARVGAWRVDGELGRGGMGSVYAVTHNGFGKRAALKLCHKSILNAQFTADTFLREARVVHLVDHPGVCDVFATGTYDGRPYLALERLTGETLGSRLERGPIAKEDALEIILELTEVLAAAHEAKVVHRDLKLDNVFLLPKPGAAGRHVKLLDWGVACILGEPDPMRGMIAGTLTYVAPEQVRGDAISSAADVYSLAVLAYQTLFGEPPFTSRSDLELIQKHLRAAPPNPSLLWPEIPGELAVLLLAMLAKDPERRPPLCEVQRVMKAALAALRPSVVRVKARWFAPASRHARQLWAAPLQAADVLGRPTITLSAKQRAMGIALGVMFLAASLVSLISV